MGRTQTGREIEIETEREKEGERKREGGRKEGRKGGKEDLVIDLRGYTDFDVTYSIP